MHGLKLPVTTLDDDLAVKTAPAGPAERPQARPRRKPKRQRQKGFKGWLSRWWWVFVVVPVAGAILVLLTLLYVYSQLELPKTPPPIQTTYVYDRDGKVLTTLHWWTGRSSRSTRCRSTCNAR